MQKATILVFWAIVALGSATIFPCFSSNNDAERIPSKKVLKPSVLTKLFFSQHKIYPACVKLLETVDDTAFEMYYSIADKYKLPLNDTVFIDGKEFHNVLILSMLKGAAEFDWKKAYSIFYRNKDFENYKETNAGTTPEEIIQKLDRMRKIDWKSYYKSFVKFASTCEPLLLRQIWRSNLEAEKMDNFFKRLNKALEDVNKLTK